MKRPWPVYQCHRGNLTVKQTNKWMYSLQSGIKLELIIGVHGLYSNVIGVL